MASCPVCQTPADLGVDHSTCPGCGRVGVHVFKLAFDVRDEPGGGQTAGLASPRLDDLRLGARQNVTTLQKAATVAELGEATLWCPQWLADLASQANLAGAARLPFSADPTLKSHCVVFIALARSAWERLAEDEAV